VPGAAADMHCAGTKIKNTPPHPLPDAAAPPFVL